MQDVRFEIDRSGAAPNLIIRGPGWTESWPLAMWGAMLTSFRWQAEHGVSELQARCDGLAEQCEAWAARHPEVFGGVEGAA